MQIRLVSVSLVLAIIAAVFLLFWPTYSGFNNNQPNHATLIEVNGTSAVVPVLFPVFVTLLPLMFRARAVVIAACATPPAPSHGRGNAI